MARFLVALSYVAGAALLGIVTASLLWGPLFQNLQPEELRKAAGLTVSLSSLFALYDKFLTALSAFRSYVKGDGSTWLSLRTSVRGVVLNAVPMWIAVLALDVVPPPSNAAAPNPLADDRLVFLAPQAPSSTPNLSFLPRIVHFEEATVRDNQLATGSSLGAERKRTLDDVFRVLESCIRPSPSDSAKEFHATIWGFASDPRIRDETTRQPHAESDKFNLSIARKRRDVVLEYFEELQKKSAVGSMLHLEKGGERWENLDDLRRDRDEKVILPDDGVQAKDLGWHHRVAVLELAGDQLGHCSVAGTQGRVASR